MPVHVEGHWLGKKVYLEKKLFWYVKGKSFRSNLSNLKAPLAESGI